MSADDLSLLLACVMAAAVVIYAAYVIGHGRGLLQSRELEDRIDGPIVWDEIKRAKRAMKGWFVA